MGNDRRLWWCAAAAAGLLAGLALPPLGWPLLLWPALAVLWAMAGSPALPPRAAALAGGLWALAAVLVSHRWLLWLHPLDWVGVPGPLSMPICAALWVSCALLGALLTAAWLALMRRLDPHRPATALLGAVLWGLAEELLARGPLFWLGLGGSALPGDRALAGLASLGGGGLIAALQLLIGWCLWRALAAPGARRRWGVVGLALVLGSHLAGAAALAAIAPGAGPVQSLMVLQPAIPTRHKFEASQQLRLLQRLLAAQRAAAAAPVTTLLLPEGALALDQPLPEPAAVEVLSGGFRRQGEEQRSSLLRFAPGEVQASTWLDKHRVVPLGEWVPLAGLWRWSGLSAVGGIEPGSPSRLLRRPAGAVGVAICYELANGSALAAATREGALWLLASANLDPYPALLQNQFAALASQRAIESGRWLVSAANTGPSLVVDARGQVRQRLPAGRSQWQGMELRQLHALTPYARWGDGPLLLLLIAGLIWRGSGSWWGRRGRLPL